MAENTFKSYQDAEKYLIENVFVPTFQQKLASFNISPKNEQELGEMLKLAEKLNYLDQINQSKYASERTDFLAQANRKLDEVLNNNVTQNRYSDQEIKEAADQLAVEKNFRDAALLYQEGLTKQ